MTFNDYFFCTGAILLTMFDYFFSLQIFYVIRTLYYYLYKCMLIFKIYLLDVPLYMIFNKQ